MESGNQAEWTLVYWTAALAIATFLLFFVAAFQDKIRNYFYKPDLDCKLILQKPDCHLLTSGHTYYIRFRIINYGNRSAKNVEVILKDLKRDGNDIILSQDNLLWSSHEKEASRPGEMTSLRERMYWDYISPKTYQYCNLCSILNPFYDEHYTEMKGKKEAQVRLTVYWPTPDFLFILPPGTYFFNIILGAENVMKSKEVKFRLSFNGKWTDDEEKMFKENISVTKLKS